MIGSMFLDGRVSVVSPGTTPFKSRDLPFGDGSSPIESGTARSCLRSSVFERWTTRSGGRIQWSWRRNQWFSSWDHWFFSPERVDSSAGPLVSFLGTTGSAAWTSGSFARTSGFIGWTSGSGEETSGFPARSTGLRVEPHCIQRLNEVVSAIGEALQTPKQPGSAIGTGWFDVLESLSKVQINLVRCLERLSNRRTRLFRRSDQPLQSPNQALQSRNQVDRMEETPSPVDGCHAEISVWMPSGCGQAK